MWQHLIYPARTGPERVLLVQTPYTCPQQSGCPLLGFRTSGIMHAPKSHAVESFWPWEKLNLKASAFRGRRSFRWWHIARTNNPLSSQRRGWRNLFIWACYQSISLLGSVRAPESRSGQRCYIRIKLKYYAWISLRNQHLQLDLPSCPFHLIWCKPMIG